MCKDEQAAMSKYARMTMPGTTASGGAYVFCAVMICSLVATAAVAGVTLSASAVASRSPPPPPMPPPPPLVPNDAVCNGTAVGSEHRVRIGYRCTRRLHGWYPDTETSPSLLGGTGSQLYSYSYDERNRKVVDAYTSMNRSVADCARDCAYWFANASTFVLDQTEIFAYTDPCKCYDDRCNVTDTSALEVAPGFVTGMTCAYPPDFVPTDHMNIRGSNGNRSRFVAAAHPPGAPPVA